MILQSKFYRYILLQLHVLIGKRWRADSGGGVQNPDNCLDLIESFCCVLRYRQVSLKAPSSIQEYKWVLLNSQRNLIKR